MSKGWNPGGQQAINDIWKKTNDRVIEEGKKYIEKKHPDATDEEKLELLNNYVVAAWLGWSGMRMP